MSNVTALEAQHVLQTYKRQPVVFVRGEGTRLFDENGRAYLDFLAARLEIPPDRLSQLNGAA